MKLNRVETTEAVALQAKFTALLKEHGRDLVTYEFDVIDLCILHGVLCLGADHPGFQDLSPQTKQAVDRFRGFCMRLWITQGLSPDEADMLDRLREQ